MKSLQAENEVTVNKMSEENQQQKMKNQVQGVTTKDPKKVEVGRRLAPQNRKKKKELKAQKSEVSQYYGIGAVLAVGVIGGLGYYIYRTKKGKAPPQPQPPQQPSPKTNKFEMD